VTETPLSYFAIMVTLTAEEKAIIQKYPIGRKLDGYREEFVAKFIPPHTPASSVLFADIVSLAAKDEGRCFLLVKARMTC
jgi:hypothetical protein